MKWMLFFSLLAIVSACNKDAGGYRENQEEKSAPHDYTRGTDSPPKQQKLNR